MSSTTPRDTPSSAKTTAAKANKDHSSNDNVARVDRASISDLAPLYDTMGETLGLLRNQVLHDQRLELEAQRAELEALKREQKMAKITGRDGAPVYAKGLLDEHGYAYVHPHSNIPDYRISSWYVRMMEFPTQPAPITALAELEVWLGGIRIVSMRDAIRLQRIGPQIDFRGNSFNLQVLPVVDLWFDVCCGTGILPEGLSHLGRHGESHRVDEHTAQMFDASTTMTFGEVCFDISTIRPFFCSMCDHELLLNVARAQQHYTLVLGAEEAVSELFPRKPNDHYSQEDFRNITPNEMAEVGRRLFLVRDALVSLGYGNIERSKKTSTGHGSIVFNPALPQRTFIAAEKLAVIVEETTTRDKFMRRVKEQFSGEGESSCI